MTGILIVGSLPGSAAAASGLTYGDVVLSVNGKPTSSVEDFLEARSLSQTHMDLLVRRGTQVFELRLDIQKRVNAEALQTVADQLTNKAPAVAPPLAAKQVKPVLN